MEQTETRAGPGGEFEEQTSLTVRLTDSPADGGGRRIVVAEVSGEGDRPGPVGARGLSGASVSVGAGGDLAVGGAGADAILLLRLVAPLVTAQNGEESPVVQVRGVDTVERNTSVHLDRSSALTAYTRGADSYAATPDYLRTFNGPLSATRPTKVETYTVDGGVNIGGTIVGVIGCALTLLLVCDIPARSPSVQKTRTVVADGPEAITAALAGAEDVAVTTVVAHGKRPVLLLAEASGKQEIAGDLTSGGGVPGGLAGKRVSVSTDWNASLELTSDWPGGSGRAAVVVWIAVAVSFVMIAAGLGLVVRRRLTIR